MVNYITVKGTYLLPDGVTPNSGYVEFRPNVALTISDTGVVFSEPLRAVLDENGYFSLRLMTTDDTSISPTGWLWFVDEKIEHGNQWYMQTKSTVNGGRDPLDITTVFYPPGASVTPPHVVDPAPIGPTGPPGKNATLYESPSEPVEGVSIGVYSELWVDTDEVIDSTNDVILSGIATPTGAIGSPGDFYLDTDDQILYGPNVASPDSIISATPFNNGAIAGSSRSLGIRFQVLRAGQITGLRFYRASSATQTGRNLSLWSDAGVLLASATTTGEFGGGWKTASLNTPYTVAVGQYYRVSYNVPNTAYYVYTPENPTTSSTSFGTLSGYQATGLDTFPNVASPGQHSFADVVLTSDPWAVAIKSVPPGGTTSQVLNKTSNSDYAVSWVSIAGGGGGGSTEVFAQTTAPTAGSTALIWVDTDDTSGSSSSPAWGNVTLWADLPMTDNWLGRKIRVTSGLGLCVALWNGTAWTVAPESDTGSLDVSASLVNGWTIVGVSDGLARVRRIGNLVINSFHMKGTAAGTLALTVPVGYRPSRTSYFPVAGVFAGTGLGTIVYGANGTYTVYNTFATFYNSGDTAITADLWPTTAP